MGYLKEFQTQIANRDFSKFVHLWEEYCTCDAVDVEEVVTLLRTIKNSDFARPFGQYVEMILPQLDTLSSEEDAYSILRLLIDLETTNNAGLADITLKALQKKYGNDQLFNERLRLVGLRTKENFQGAISNFDLLAHIQKGNFVFHPSGWGVGEIMEHSAIREQLVVEFENVSGLKTITFSNAFKALVPLVNTHFLARRFSNPDKLEEEAKANPIEVIKCLLRDLGPKTASEIKDELCELVIPESDWQKWWQNARAKMKKDTEIESPDSARDPFLLRKVAVSHEEQFLESLKKKRSPSEILQTCYNFTRDYSSKIKVPEVKAALTASLEGILGHPGLSNALALQTYFCLDGIQDKKHDAEIAKLIRDCDDLDAMLENMEIIAYKKLALIAIKAHRPDWQKAFVRLLHTIPQGLLRDYIFKELIQSDQKELLVKSLKDLLEHPWKDPDFFNWYFGKVMEEGSKFDLHNDKEGQCQLAESFMVLLNRIENDTGQKDLIKKMYNTLTNKRYELVRRLFEGCSLEFAKEFILLASKCHTLTDRDLKSLRALVEVVHPSMSSGDKQKQRAQSNQHILWTTEEGYQRTHDRVKQIGTKEIVDNAKEIEAARALGDLRENSEYKYALEKRSRLQGELKTLSEQLSRARVIAPDDVPQGEIGVGSVIEATNGKGKVEKFKLLGPWEADPDNNILSFQSKLAQSMVGLKVGDSFPYKDGNLKIVKIASIFDK